MFSTKKTSTHRICSKISGLSRSRCFIRSFIAVIIELALSSAPCFDDFSAAPANDTTQAMQGLFASIAGCATKASPPCARSRYGHPKPWPGQILTTIIKLYVTLEYYQIWSGQWPRAAPSRSGTEHNAFIQHFSREQNLEKLVYVKLWGYKGVFSVVNDYLL